MDQLLMHKEEQMALKNEIEELLGGPDTAIKMGKDETDRELLNPSKTSSKGKKGNMEKP